MIFKKKEQNFLFFNFFVWNYTHRYIFLFILCYAKGQENIDFVVERYHLLCFVLFILRQPEHNTFMCMFIVRTYSQESKVFFSCFFIHSSVTCDKSLL